MSLAVQPIWPEVVRWELPSVMGGLDLIGTVAGKAPKLKLDWALFKVGWGRVARQLCDGANNTTNRLEVISP